MTNKEKMLADCLLDMTMKMKDINKKERYQYLKKIDKLKIKDFKQKRWIFSLFATFAVFSLTKV